MLVLWKLSVQLQAIFPYFLDHVKAVGLCCQVAEFDKSSDLLMKTNGNTKLHPTQQQSAIKFEWNQKTHIWTCHLKNIPEEAL